ncbi:MAG: pyridoxamine 5'-phosphate oxidase family protein [Syntrophales bacterium]|nr:pyridoxamine 5'-phosphate oxidase family protein [Syntrophales bacterium]
MLKNYFETTDGTGILATADSSGKVNGAVYGKPHFIDDETIAFIMADRLTHHNLQSNFSACYIFREEGEGYRGKRLYLTKTKEEDDPEIIDKTRRGKPHGSPEKESPKYLVYFQIDKVLPLVGTVSK